jgi:hypothetical protein
VSSRPSTSSLSVGSPEAPVVAAGRAPVRSGWGTALLVTMMAFAGSARAQAPDEAQIKAAFVYNFLKFVEWPVGVFLRLEDPLVVAIVGDGATADAVEQFLAAKQVGDHRIVIRRQRWDQPLAGAHATFVGEDDVKKVRRLLDSAAGAAVLSIGEGAGFASRGGMIALIIDGRRVRFDIDTDAAVAARLRISSKLLALGRVIHATRIGAVETP